MKKPIILGLLFFAIACEPDTETLEGKQKMLSEKQNELAELREDIKDLEAEIAEMDTTRQAMAASTPVEVKTLVPENFSHYLEVTGTVASKENIMISAEAGGRVVNIPAEEGQVVSKGDVLVRIDNENVANQLEEAKAAFELAETTFEKRKNLWEKNIGSEIEYLQAKNNYETTRSRLAQIRTTYENTIIKSPIDGRVDKISVNEGEFVSMGTQVVRVVNLNRVHVEAELSEEYLSAVKEGDSVQVGFPALNMVSKAPVTFVSRVINPENRSFEIQVALPEKNDQVKPNLLANLRIRDYTADSALVIPSSSISKDLRGSFVYVANERDERRVATKKYIETGSSSGAETEVLKGLEAGDKVITAGYNQVNEGQNVNIR